MISEKHNLLPYKDILFFLFMMLKEKNNKNKFHISHLENSCLELFQSCVTPVYCLAQNNNLTSSVLSTNI